MAQERITTLLELRMVAKMRLCVHVPTSPCFRRHIPAVFILNMTGSVILGLFESGMYVYHPKKRRRAKWSS